MKHWVSKTVVAAAAGLSLLLSVGESRANLTPSFKLVNDGVYLIEGGAFDGRFGLALGFSSVTDTAQIQSQAGLESLFSGNGDRIDAFLFGNSNLGPLGEEIDASDFVLDLPDTSRIFTGIIGIIEDGFTGNIVAREQFGFSGTETFNVGQLRSDPFRLPSTDVPEPATIALLGAGLIGLAAAARRRRKV